MKKYYLGIDLGTSSAKGILRSTDGDVHKAKIKYSSATLDGWLDALGKLFCEFSIEARDKIAAIALSSQVGTYIIDKKDIIHWHSDIGHGELQRIKSKISDSEFKKELSMLHPELISYPLPRLLHIQNKYGENVKVLMPKELLIKELTGNTVTDIFSMRGIADLDKGKYADKLIERLGIKLELPPIKSPFDLAGLVSEEAAKKYGIAPNIPVYLGCNDFFAGLLGMGVYNIGYAFDLSGTSEHLGYIGEDINDNAFVSGKYFNGNCSYGGTKSSGPSCDLAIDTFGLDGLDIDEILENSPPIFLPYLNGERAPIFDNDARGVYFGLNTSTTKKELAYATLEGVVFSLYDIATSMNMPTPNKLICGGGSAQNKLMNKLRASIFDCDVVSVCENDTSSLGACMIAMIGDGIYKDISEAISDCIKYNDPIKPDPKYKDILRKRFLIYKELYRNLKSSFKKLNEIKEIKK